ncbi:hypothetical protein KAW80_03585 [Candidatus Babeliales bacterium]|nr:hypothetical protein [Candidatus Babeliales bacterium]
MENEILKSASKIVFILMAVAVIALTFLRVVDSKDFMVLASMAFAFYFANKGDSNLPYAGK